MNRREQRRYWECTRKAQYSSLETAQAAADRQNAVLKDSLLQPYECRFCVYWHIGNELSKAEARKSLNRINKMMGHPNFWIKVPADIINKYIVLREKMQRRAGQHE